jgi:hypothetical protein
LSERKRAAIVEKRFVIEPQYRQIHSRRHRFNARRNVARRLIRLDIYLARIFDDVCVGQNPLAIDDNAGAFDLLRAILGPRTKQIGV